MNVTRGLPVLLLAVLALRCGTESPPPATAAPVVAGTPLTARIVEGTAMGLGTGTAIAAGASIQTAPTERAKIELSDGSTVILDHETKLTLEAAPRQVRFESGNAVFEVAVVPGSPPLKVKLLGSEGEAEVLGTKLAVREDEGRALIDVSRGEVRLNCPRGTDVVRAGEQGVMLPGTAPTVGPAPDLGAAIAWSESGATDDEAGVGSLRARNPRGPAGNEQPLRLADHKVTVRIVGAIARTEVEQVFANEGNQELEGTYRFPLPAGARIASMALDVDGQLREGRFVDRAVGERIWRGVIKNARMGGRLGRVDTDDILFAPGNWRDPALLAWDAGNRFSVRIFPIRPNSTRRVRIAYVETLGNTADGRRYVYPLPQGQWASIGRSVADRLHVDVRVTGHDAGKPVLVKGLNLAARDEGGVRVLSTEAERFIPSGNLVVEMAEAGKSDVRAASYRDGADLFAVLALRPSLPRAENARPIEHVVLLDSSYGSQGEMWRRQVAVVQALVKEMSADDRVTVLTCDIGCRTIGSPAQVPSNDLVTALGDALFRIETGGTGDVVRAVREGVRMVTSSGGRAPHLVYVGDGIATVGVRDPGRLAEMVARETSRTSVAVSTIAVGTTCDERTLAEVSRRTGGVAVAYAPGDDAPSLALRMLGRLRGSTLRDVRITFPGGATEVAPSVLPAIHAGEEVWVAAKIPAATSGDVVLSGTVNGRPFETRYPVSFADAANAATAFVPAIWAEKRAYDLAAGGAANREAVVALGERYGLVTPFTSLLVLDSDALAERLGLGERTTAPQFTGETEEDDKPEEGEAQGQGADEQLDAPVATTTPAPPRPARPESRSRDAEDARQAQPGAAQGGVVGRTGGAGGGEGAASQPAPVAPPAPPAEPAGAAEEAPADDVATPDGERSARRGPPAGGGAAIDGLMGDSMGGRGGWGGWRERPRRPVRVGRVGSLRPGPVGLAGASQNVLREVAELKAKVQAEPDRRVNHRDLAKILARIGEVAEGTTVVRGWLSRDAMDVDALTFLSDMQARSGDRERAIRTLASVVEVQPGEKSSHERMAKVYERAGRAEDACAHRVTLAALSPTDDAAAAAGTRCETTQETPAADTIRGNLVIGGSWTGGVDLDVNVVYRDGTRVSWMGGKRNVRAAEATSTAGERLGIGFLPNGTYTIEVVRASGESGPPVDGTLEIRVLGERRSARFRLEQNAARVAAAQVTVRTEFR